MGRPEAGVDESQEGPHERWVSGGPIDPSENRLFVQSFVALLRQCRRVAGRQTCRKRFRRFQPDSPRLEPRIAPSGEGHTAYEIAYLGDLGANYTGPIEAYLAGGSNPINAEEWANYTPPPGYIKNTTRNLQFNLSYFFSSPDATGTTYITTSDGYTWEYIAKTVSSMWPFKPSDYPGRHYTSGYEAAAFTVTPPDGVIKWTSITKNQQITWYARDSNGRPIERYFIKDPWGDRFIMQASGVADQADVRSNFLKAVLPKGWTKSIGFLKRNLTTLPAYNASGTPNYYIFRDSSDDSFEQISWGRLGWGTSQMIVDMPIWGRYERQCHSHESKARQRCVRRGRQRSYPRRRLH